ncbi:MAG: DUF4331 domain-containing protein [Candidatus Sumerlaeaceae bacterium]
MPAAIRTVKLGWAAGAICLLTPAVQAASHSDAPLQVQDPAANISDVYTFITAPGGQKKLNIVANYNPQEDPGNGINFYRFADSVLYSLHVVKATNTSGTVEFQTDPTITYNFRFSSILKNPNTAFLYGIGTEAGPIQASGDSHQNLDQTYTVEKLTPKSASSDLRSRTSTDVTAGTYMVPPVNVGPKTTPKYYVTSQTLVQGATAELELDDYTRNSLFTTADGARVFAGQRDDGFYGDTAGIFDLVNLTNPGRDSFAGFNVQTIAMQIPLEQIVGSGDVPIVGVFATTSRRKTNIQRGLKENKLNKGKWVQVSRMGNPLFNEVLVAQADKELYNQDTPTNDASRYGKYALNPEIAVVLNLLLGTSFQTTNRTDLFGFFIPDVLKIDTSTPPVPLAGQPGFSRLSLFGGDNTLSPYQGTTIPSGWPNGRRLGDDVIDIALTAVASGPSYNPITPVGDNVNGNDVLYDQVFPYAPTPDGGPTSSLHACPETMNQP